MTREAPVDVTGIFRDKFTEELIRCWPDDVPPTEEALRWAVAAVTKTWVATHARWTFDLKQGEQYRWVVQTPWSTNGLGGS